MTVIIKKKNLDDLFPANIIIGKNLEFLDVGKSIRDHLAEIDIGSNLFDHFNVTGGSHPGYFDFPADSIKSLHLTSKCGGYKLAGVIVPQNEGFLLALRHVPTEKIFNERKLQISDFAPGDPAVQGLMLINLQRAMIEESQDTAFELAFERQRSVELLERISRIAGYMAHDFNNLLSIIRLNCDRLSREFGSTERVDKLVNIIRETAVRGSSVTGSLMKLSHQRTDTHMPITIDELIEDNLAFLRAVVGSTVTLSVNLGTGTAQSIVSHVRLLNCLTNLLLNSRDAMPTGGEIKITTEIRWAALDGGKNDPQTPMREFIAVEISDNGVGMTAAVLSRAFEPLFSTKVNGNGFGLASALEFAREMGGDACLESAPGEGAKVYLYFPLLSQSVSDQPIDIRKDSDEPRMTSAKGRILLVEDEPYALEALVEMLEADGYAVTACETAAQALQAVETGDYHVLLTDIIMPGQRGTELAGLVCDQRPKTKVILMSGYVPDTADIRPGWMFVRKPMDSRELMSMIESAVASFAHH